MIVKAVFHQEILREATSLFFAFLLESCGIVLIGLGQKTVAGREKKSPMEIESF